MKNILFICKCNVFRSKVAEAYFKKINRNKNIKVKSAGLISGAGRDPRITKTCKELGIKLKGKSRGVSIKLIKWSDIIVVVANDVPKNIFKFNKKYQKKVILWKIKDVFSTNRNISLARKRTIKKMIKKVDKLNKTLEKEK